MKSRTQDKKYKLADGGGLCLLVQPWGGKSWLWRYRFDGAEKNMTFGEYPLVGAKDARELHHAAKRLLVTGVKPMAERNAEAEALKVQRLYSEEFVCILSKTHPYKGKAFTIKQYLKLKHIVIETQAGQQTLVDKLLAEKDYRRNISLQMPYFIPAIAAIEGTDYVLTCPARLANKMLSIYPLRQVKAPIPSTQRRYRRLFSAIIAPF